MSRRLKRTIAHVIGIIVLVACSSFLAWWFWGLLAGRGPAPLGGLCLGLILGLAFAPRLARRGARRKRTDVSSPKKKKKNWGWVGPLEWLRGARS